MCRDYSLKKNKNTIKQTVINHTAAAAGNGGMLSAPEVCFDWGS